jgi:hypothetical protein
MAAVSQEAVEPWEDDLGWKRLGAQELDNDGYAPKA